MALSYGFHSISVSDPILDSFMLYDSLRLIAPRHILNNI
ncbi:hypothetical protein LINGRAHAP2_LOCUS16814 [Linum grandiflorum]